VCFGAVVFEWIIINNYSLYHCLRGDTAIEIRIVNVQSIYYIIFTYIFTKYDIHLRDQRKMNVSL